MTTLKNITLEEMQRRMASNFETIETYQMLQDEAKSQEEFDQLQFEINKYERANNALVTELKRRIKAKK